MVRRLTPRANLQSRSDPILAMADEHAKKLVLPMKRALLHLRTVVPLATVTHAIKLGSIDAVISAIPFEHYKQVLREPAQIMGDVYEAAAHHGTKHLRSKLKGKHLRYMRKDAEDEIGLAFDRFDKATQERLAALLDELIDDLSDSAKETIQSVILSGLRAGDSADDIAENIRDTISLTPQQAEAVANYRRALEDLDQGALNRALRDSSFDDVVQDAIDSGEFLPDGVISDAVDAYLENYIDYRAATISRTESLRAANAGLRDGYTQASERGAIPAEAVKRVWLLDLDENTCDICLGILDANPDGVGLDEEFSEGDPPVHPNCRCTIQYETDLDQVPDEVDETQDEDA